MKTTEQDQYYLDVEANAFFERNKYDFTQLPDKKRKLIEQFLPALKKNKIKNILELGCHIGDLLNYTVAELGANRGHGIEPSSRSVQIGKESFKDKCDIHVGIAANHVLMESIPRCELIVVNDVFCWISRDSILQSIANIDGRLNDGGYIIIRDFLPDQRLRNLNHHAVNNSIYCYKILGSHASLFTQTGNYQVMQSRVFIDGSQELSKTNEYDFTQNRWIDVLLKKGWV